MPVHLYWKFWSLRSCCINFALPDDDGDSLGKTVLHVIFRNWHELLCFGSGLLEVLWRKPLALSFDRVATIVQCGHDLNRWSQVFGACLDQRIEELLYLLDMISRTILKRMLVLGFNLAVLCMPD